VNKIGNEDSLESIIAKQRVLGTRLLWLSILPFVIAAVLVPMFFVLNARLKDIEIGTEVVTIERFLESDKNFAWAVDQYEHLADTNPSAAILSRLGILYFLQDTTHTDDNALKKALDTLDNAKRYDPNYWEIYRSLTYIYTQRKRYKDAIEAGQKAIALNKLDANTFNNLAWVYANCEPECIDLNKATNFAEEAVQLTNEALPEFLDTLAVVLFKRNLADDRENSRKYINKAISIAPKAGTQAFVARLTEYFPNRSR
jgi:tetratricopeptide (TPR) repeat protein